MRIDKNFPFRDIRYVETIPGENICKIHFVNGAPLETNENMAELCAKFANIMKDLKASNQLDEDFYLYKVGRRHILNIDYLVCLNPQEGSVLIADAPELKYKEIWDIGEYSLRNLKKKLIPEEIFKELERRKRQANARMKEEKAKRLIQDLNDYNAGKKMESSTVLLGFITADDSPYNKQRCLAVPPFYRPCDFEDDVCVI